MKNNQHIAGENPFKKIDGRRSGWVWFRYDWIWGKAEARLSVMLELAVFNFQLTLHYFLNYNLTKCAEE